MLKEALKTGILDFITTDHSPAPPDIKQIDTGNFQTGWGGIAGLQFLLPASWSALKKTISLEKFIPLLTSHPAQFLKIADRKGKIQVGYDADLVIWRPEEKQEITKEKILHRHKISPYVGIKLHGIVRQTILSGVTICNNQHISEGLKKGRTILNKHL